MINLVVGLPFVYLADKQKILQFCWEKKIYLIMNFFIKSKKKDIIIWVYMQWLYILLSANRFL